jgi:stress response protein YsnF
MPALDPDTRERWRDMVVVDRDAVTIGTIDRFYLDRASGLPTWALVKAGWLGDRRSFVPLADAVEVDGEIHVPYAKAQVQQAPQVGSVPELDADQELILAGHYGLYDRHGSVAEPTSESHPPTPESHPPLAGPPNREGSPAAQAEAPVVHTPPTQAGEGGVAVTRSEEELTIGKRTRLRRLRLRKYVVIEYVTRTFPVRREEVRLEELPGGELAEAGADHWGAADQSGAPELELVLHREEPEVRLRPVPVERVRLRRQLVTEQRTVTAQLGKERVEVTQDPRP